MSNTQLERNDQTNRLLPFVDQGIGLDPSTLQLTYGLDEVCLRPARPRVVCSGCKTPNCSERTEAKASSVAVPSAGVWLGRMFENAMSTMDFSRAGDSASCSLRSVHTNSSRARCAWYVVTHVPTGYSLHNSPCAPVAMPVHVANEQQTSTRPPRSSFATHGQCRVNRCPSFQRRSLQCPHGSTHSTGSPSPSIQADS